MPLHRMFRSLRTIAVVGAVVGAACSGSETAAPQPAPSVPAIVRLVVPTRNGSVVLSGTLTVPVTAYDQIGNAVARPTGLTFVSRNPAVADVDSAGVVTGRTFGGQAWVVASVRAGAATLADSMLVTVACTSDLRVEMTPDEARLHVGETLALRGRYLGCLGQLELADTLTWRSGNVAVARVDSVTGVVTAAAPGTAIVSMIGRRYAVPGGATITVAP